MSRRNDAREGRHGSSTPAWSGCDVSRRTTASCCHLEPERPAGCSSIFFYTKLRAGRIGCII